MHESLVAHVHGPPHSRRPIEDQFGMATQNLSKYGNLTISKAKRIGLAWLRFHNKWFLLKYNKVLPKCI